MRLMTMSMSVIVEKIHSNYSKSLKPWNEDEHYLICFYLQHGMEIFCENQTFCVRHLNIIIYIYACDDIIRHIATHCGKILLFTFLRPDWFACPPIPKFQLPR
jgi:hypothetical protein